MSYGVEVHVVRVHSGHGVGGCVVEEEVVPTEGVAGLFPVRIPCAPPGHPKSTYLPGILHELV